MTRFGTASRRAFLSALLAATGARLLPPCATALAMGRMPEGGSATLVLPWSLRRLDPHDVDDVIAALFGAAIADPLFATDRTGSPYPALALELPERVGSSTRVRLRPGLVTANGAALDAKDVQASILRSKQRGGMSLLAPITKTLIDPREPTALFVDGLSPEELARRLTSPLTALLPRRFSPLDPDGTGPFKATLRLDHLRLDRNLNAARGPSLLARIDVHSAAELSEALRAFETGDSDLGWLGSGLYRQRGDSRPLDGGALGWVILRTGASAQRWGAPGVAQQLADHLDAQRLIHLGVTAERPVGSSTGWGGPPGAVLVDGTAPQLTRVAESVSEQLGSARHELSLEPVPPAELARRRKTGQFSLMVDFVRSPGPLPPHFALLAASNPEIANSLPPSLAFSTARLATRTLRLGVIGELRIVGAIASALRGLGAWDLAGAWRVRPQSAK